MNKVLLIVIFILFSFSASADSFRCKGKIVKSGDTVNALLKNVGMLTEHSRLPRQSTIGVTYLKSTLRIMSMSVADRRTLGV